MPIVTVQMLEGRTEEQKRELCDKVTQAVSESVGAPTEGIWVVIEEMKKENFAKGGKRISDQ